MLSFPVSPSSLLAVTSRYCSYQYIPRWHFSLATCQCIVIILVYPSVHYIRYDSVKQFLPLIGFGLAILSNFIQPQGEASTHGTVGLRKSWETPLSPQAGASHLMNFYDIVCFLPSS